MQQLSKRDYLFPLIIGLLDGFILLYIINKTPDLYFKLAGISNHFWALPIALAIAALIGMIAFNALKIFQIAKFLIAGTLNVFVDTFFSKVLMLAFNIFEGPIALVFKAISFSIATVNSYLWNKFWTFEKKETQGAGTEFVKFYLVTAIGLCINVGAFHIVINIIKPQFGLSVSIWALVGTIVAALASAVWNFLAYKIVVFKK